MEYALAIGSAFWFGILTSISPCPLATNIAAISFVGRKIGSAPAVLAAGVLYACGRTIAYASLGILLAGGLTAAPEVSQRGGTIPDGAAVDSGRNGTSEASDAARDFGWHR